MVKSSVITWEVHDRVGSSDLNTFQSSSTTLATLKDLVLKC